MAGASPITSIRELAAYHRGGMKNSGVIVLVVALAVVVLEMAIGVSPGGILTSVVGAGIIYMLFLRRRL